MIFVNLLLGHLTGDYLLQNDWMARNKTRNDWTGWLAALVHCLIYTAVIILFTGLYDWYWIVAVFLSHFPIDKFGFGTWYMKAIKGYDMKQFMSNETPNYEMVNYRENYKIRMLQAGFMAVVYTITDNTMHLLLMWGAYNLLY